MTTHSIQTRYDKKVTVQTYKPTAASLLLLLQEHAHNTDTSLDEWEVDIDKVANEISSVQPLGMFNASRFRWEITLTRRIK